MNRGLVAVIGLTIILTACTTAQNSEALPTLAAPPTALGVEVSLSTPVATFAPTPTLAMIDQELTRVFSDATLKQDVIDSLQVIGLDAITPDAQTIETSLVGRAYIHIGFDIIKQAMLIEGVESKLLGGTATNNNYLFRYQYTTDEAAFNVQQRIPYMLCGLQEAGLINQYVEFTIEQIKSDDSSGSGVMMCIAPGTIATLDCSAPSRIDLEAIQSRPVTECGE